MRLSKEVPAIKESLSENKLTLTNVSLMGSLFKEVNVNKEDKQHLISQVEGKSRRECEEIIKKVKRDHGIKTQDFVTIKVTKEAYDALLSLQNETQQKTLSDGIIKTRENYQTQKIDKLKPQRESTPAIKNSRFIPKPIKYAVYTKNQGRCAKCGGFHYLEYEHNRAALSEL